MSTLFVLLEKNPSGIAALGPAITNAEFTGAGKSIDLLPFLIFGVA